MRLLIAVWLYLKLKESDAELRGVQRAQLAVLKGLVK